MKLTGSYNIPVDKKTVWDALNNPDILKQAIPGCDEFVKNSETSFTATATNKIGPFNASFTGEVELKDLNPPNSYKIVGEGNSAVGFASGEAFVELADNNGVTTLSYTVEANVGGKIAQVGSRLIDMTAKKMADIFFGKFSELVTPEDKKLEKNTPEPKEGSNKKLIYIHAAGALIILTALAVYFLK
jgi:carbon monoxide dehydrogenase subunit G|tara:strand:+ start:1118 stop:1678 length:561 start_codon:yes stop_codon:yes gene_type:complete